jgi:uncharacterized protein (DUF58 family)
MRPVRPGRGLLRLLGLWAVLGVAASLWRFLLPVWGAAGLALAALAAWGLIWVRRVPALGAERRVAASLALGVVSPVSLRLTNPGPAPLDLEVFDHHPDTAEPEGLPRRVTVPAGGWAEIGYRLRPRRRGDRRFGPVGLLVRSPGDLWRRPMEAGAGETVRVIPDFQAVSRYALRALSDPLGRIGVKVGRRRGEGSEFQQLRDYRPGDSLRRIDWKATSRRQQLISREYSEERNQQVVCLIDCGRRMRARDGDLGHFDQVLNTVLLLAFVALRQGDAVGVMTFSGERRWLPPAKGRRALAEILHRVYDLETTHAPSDYLEAATELMVRQRRRALVVLLSNLRDEDSHELKNALELLRTRNLVLVASLREAALSDRLKRPPRDLRDALTVASVHRYLESRRRAFEALQVRGVLSVDVEPELLPARIVNRYLEVKRSGLL